MSSLSPALRIEVLSGQPDEQEQAAISLGCLLLQSSDQQPGSLPQLSAWQQTARRQALRSETPAGVSSQLWRG